MLKTCKYRLYPTTEQEKLLTAHFGAVRLVYNLALEVRLMGYHSTGKFISKYDLIKQLPALKKECEWLKKVNAQSLVSSILNQEVAWQRLFKRAGGFPKFKSKKHSNSFQCPQKVYVNFDTQRLKLPKFKTPLKIVIDRRFTGKIKTVTISKTPTNKYFASMLVDDDKAIPEKKPIITDTTIGIDLNIGNTAVLSNSEYFKNPKNLNKSTSRLKALQRRLSRKEKGTGRYKKLTLTIARRHEQIANQRKDFLHKISHRITNDWDTLVFEDLNVSGMMQNHKLSRSIGDSGWGMLKDFCKYKCERRGKNFIEIGRFEPSSKMCSNCGEMNNILTLQDREWKCVSCGSSHNRDVNAAINIKQIGLSNFHRGSTGRGRGDVGNSLVNEASNSQT